MKKFEVVIEGRDFLISLDGKDGKYGFFTTRFVEAENPDKAENVTVNLIRDELKETVLNDKSDPPTMNLSKIYEIDDFGDNLVPGSGFTWFESD